MGIKTLLDKVMGWLAAKLHWMPSYDSLTDITLTTMPPEAPKQPQDTSSAPISNTERFIQAAKDCLGKNLSLGTGVDPEVACAISVNQVHQKAFGFPIGGGASTQAMYQVLLKSPYFKEISTEEPGCVVISPTGYSLNPKYPHGHVGISGHYGICSNDSATGLFYENYTWSSWRQQFQTIEGYPVYIFQRVNN